MARPTRLKYTGNLREVKDDAGNVIRIEADRYFGGVPARDLDDEDIAQLSDDELANILGGGDPLYVDPDSQPTGFRALTVSELRNEAERIGLDLEGATRKDDIITRLKAVEPEGPGAVDDAPTEDAVEESTDAEADEGDAA